MTERAERNFGTWTWAVVVLVGLIVVTLVLGLRLFSRLSAGQDTVNGLRAPFQDQRVAGTRAGVNMVSAITDTATPILTTSGGAAGEVPALINFLSLKTGLPADKIDSTLKQAAPHTAALLAAVPLESVSAELPGLVSFLSAKLNLPPDQVLAALNQNFPHLAQAVNNLPAVTSGYNNVPGLENLTNFSGQPVRSYPQFRDYVSKDVWPVVESQRANFQNLDTTSPQLTVFAPLLLVIGLFAVVYGAVMLVLFRRLGILHPTRQMTRVAQPAWLVIAILGAFVLVLVFAWSLVPRLTAGQQVISNAAPVFTDARIAADAKGVQFTSTIVDTLDPITTQQGGAAAEVPKLVSFVSQKTGLSESQVLGALQANFPHTTALLQALPLESVTAELPAVLNLLGQLLNEPTPAALQTDVQTFFPHLGQAIANLPTVTNGWNNIQGINGMTRYDGSPVQSVPQFRDYAAKDLVPTLVAANPRFQELNSLPPPVNWVPPLLIVAGAVVLYYGLIMLYIWRPRRTPSAAGQAAYPTSARRQPV